MKFNYLDFDIYSNRICFFYNDKEKISTILGQFLTILYILLSLIIFIVYILHTIKRKNLKVFESKFYSKELPNIDINPSLILAFGLEDPSSSDRFIDEAIYYPVIEFIEKEKKDGVFNTTDRTKLEYEVCQKEKFGENFFIDGGEGGKFELNNSYCLKDFNLSLKGGYKYDKFSFLRIKLYPCVNNTNENHNNCETQETIDKYLKDGSFSILTKDIGLNPSNYSFPIIPTVRDIHIPIDESLHKKYIIYYSIAEIETDTGLFKENIKKDKYIQFRKEIQNFYLRNNDYSEIYEDKDKAIISIDFRLDDIIFIQKRTYTKITDILYIIGGYMQLLNTIFSLLSLLSNRLIPYLEILNGIFNFNFKEKKMSMKISTIKEFNSSDSYKGLFIPSNKQIPAAKNIYRNSLKINDDKLNNNNNNNNNNNLSKNSLMGLDNTENNISTSNIFKQRKYNSLRVIREKENEKSNNSNNNNSSVAKASMSNGRKNNIGNENDDNNRKKNNNENKNYIYRIGSFYPRFLTSEKKVNSSNSELLGDDINKIKFNLFDYYCFGSMSRKKKHIELYKSGLSLYTKRMDIINVFTLLFLAEKHCLQTDEFY